MIKCIFTNIKNEHRYIEDWLEYHIRMGFNKFILFEDEGSISHTEILNKYSKVTNIDFYDNILSNDNIELKDVTCFKYILDNYNDIDWIIKLDPDEYFVVDDDKTIDDIIYNINDNVNQIEVKWKLYNASGFIEQPYPGKYSLINTYFGDIDVDNLATYFNSNVSINEYTIGKSLLRYKWFYDIVNKTEILPIFGSFPHIITDATPVNSLPNLHINHYITKSFEEFYDRLKNKGEYNKEWHRKLGDFFVLNPDLIPKIPEIESKFNVDVFSFKTKLV